jgi:SAM-dependent methyltransferase
MKALVFCFALLLAPGLLAQTEYEPSVGQPGKDVVWVPTPDTLITQMLRMAEVKPQDLVVDLGSGDGRIPIAAAREFGAHAMGVEFNPDMVALSKRNAQKAGVTDKVKFVEGDIFQTDLSSADVVAMYLLPKLNMELRPKLLALKPGTRIVTHAFDMGDWQYDQRATAEDRHAYMWIVPAQLAGQWRVDLGKQTLELSLEQKYQMLSGRARLGGEPLSISTGRVKGELVQLLLKDAQGRERLFNGQIKNGALSGRLQ